MKVSTSEIQQTALARLAAELRSFGWELAVGVVEEGLQNDTVASLARLDRASQLGNMPTFISELAQELAEPQPDRLRRGSPLSVLAREHAREREALGFAPREIVTEFLLLRRVLWRFVSQRTAEFDAGDVLLVERRLNDTIDRLVAECVVAYFDRATSELSYQARHDPLTDLLNHQAFTRELELELERARRYQHGVTLVFFDFDKFKQVNDTLGHPAGDAVLKRIAELLQNSLRRSDLAGRMGGDEFAAFLVESDEETAGRFLERLHDGIDELISNDDLPDLVAISAGVAHHPTDGQTADSLFRVADKRLYESKRFKTA